MHSGVQLQDKHPSAVTVPSKASPAMGRRTSHFSQGNRRRQRRELKHARNNENTQFTSFSCLFL